ncbi:MAG: DUF1176 domain-containing protein [Rhodospirillales bacterium]|nr:DUF1176 domain-containing protein [Rhodospirillales bacterium]
MIHRAVRNLALLLVALVVGGSPVIAQGIQAPAERTFRDWVVGCDNARACTAVGMIPAENIDVAFIHVYRAAGPGAPPQFSVVIYDDTSPADRRMSISLDGAPIDRVASSRLGQPVLEFDGFRQSTLSDAEVGPFVVALRRGSRLQVGIDGGVSAEVSLDGAMAALLFIDDMQGRIDTATALARRGSRPAASVSAATPLPLLRAQPAGDVGITDRRAAAVRAGWATQAARACAQSEAAESTEPETMAPLSGGRILIGVGCGGGAYNFDTVFGIAEPGDPLRVTPARFMPPPVDGSGPGGVGESLTNAFFDPATTSLRFSTKGRGIGDCGSSGRYVWTGDTFMLAEWRAMPACRGVPEPFWPELWRSRDQ